MRVIRIIICGVMTLGSFRPVLCYELSTHGSITQRTYQRVIQDKPELLPTLGLSDSAQRLGDFYFDNYRGDIRTRQPDLFEGRIIQTLGSSVLSLEGWLMRGAIREDDVPTLFGGNPADPYGSIFRVFNHFYDPRNDQGLTVGAFQGAKAPDWGIGASDAFADENAADAFRRNHFTVFDAREAMFRALTGMSGSGSRAIGAGGSEPGTAADKLAVRKAYWATTFRALGDIVHLIQDMAQPQHTRNDPHAGSDNYEQPAGPGGHASFYESYIDQRATQTPVTESNGSTYTPAALAYDTSPSPYPIPRFNDYVSYFSTRNVHASVVSRKGMADYSNRGFFSAGKNLGQGDYDLPPNSISGGFYTPEQRAVNADGATVHLLKGSVTDAHASPAATNVPLTAFGAWNDALQQTTNQESFTLIRENYDAMAELLIPRAVAYSAGLIDYFFRGRMEIALPDEGVYAILDHAVEDTVDEGFRRVKLKLSNTTPAINDGQTSYPQAMTGGTLWAVAKFQRNGCYQPDLSGEPGLTSCDYNVNRGQEEIVVSDPITVQLLDVAPQQFTFEFRNAPIPVNAVNIVLQVVYRGELGSEHDAVVVGTRDISEPTFIEIMNNTDYHLIDGVYYRPDEIRNDPVLLSRVNDEAWLDPVEQSVTFNFGGGQVGATTIPPSAYARFGVMADYPSVVVNVRSHTWSRWTMLTAHANEHRYDPVAREYVILEIPSATSRNTHYHKLLSYFKWSGTYDSEAADNTEGLDDVDDLDPRPIDVQF